MDKKKVISLQLTANQPLTKYRHPVKEQKSVEGQAKVITQKDIA